MKHLLVTGGAGFIGSNFVELALAAGYRITILDALTYAGHPANFSAFLAPGKCAFKHGRIEDSALLTSLFSENSFDGVIHFAAESHVDNSITDPRQFLVTNIMGTFELLEAAKVYWKRSQKEKRDGFRFVHVSTDEVFGTLGDDGHFTEETAYSPNSPYSASKAGSDHLARAWFHTYGVPVIVTNCSNNYGPRQFPEKLIPRMITNALGGKKLPIYGKGLNIRDWIHVHDHSRGVLQAYEKGVPGSSYCFGGNSERRNIDVVRGICNLLDELSPQANGQSYSTLMEFVEDRPGHDYRYAIDDKKAQELLGFRRKFRDFESGLRQTVTWYLENSNWLETISKQHSEKR